MLRKISFALILVVTFLVTATTATAVTLECTSALENSAWYTERDNELNQLIEQKISEGEITWGWTSAVDLEERKEASKRLPPVLYQTTMKEFEAAVLNPLYPPMELYCLETQLLAQGNGPVNPDLWETAWKVRQNILYHFGDE